MAANQAPIIMMSQGRQDDLQRQTLHSILKLAQSQIDHLQRSEVRDKDLAEQFERLCQQHVQLLTKLESLK